jgi:hypothetical protein
VAAKPPVGVGGGFLVRVWRGVGVGKVTYCPRRSSRGDRREERSKASGVARACCP